MMTYIILLDYVRHNISLLSLQPTVGYGREAHVSTVIVRCLWGGGGEQT